MPDVDPVAALRLYALRILEVTTSHTIGEWLDQAEAAMQARYPHVDPDVLQAYLARWLADDNEPVVAAMPDDWDAWQAERDARQRAEQDAAMARIARSREAWPAYLAGRITAEQRDAWIAGGPNPMEAIEREETAALLAAAEAGFRAEEELGWNAEPAVRAGRVRIVTGI